MIDRDLLALVVEDSPIAVAIVNGPEHHVAYGNARFWTAVGRAKDTQARHRFRDLVPYPAAIAALDDVAADGRRRRLVDFEILPPGRTRPAFWNIDIDPLRGADGVVQGTVVRAVNVTRTVASRRIADRRSREAEDARRLLKALLRHAPLGIAIADAPSATVRFVSEFGRRMLVPWPTEEEPADRTALRMLRAWEVIGGGERLTAPEGLPLFRAARRGETVIDEPWIFRAVEGRETICRVSAAPIPDAEGKVRWACLVWHDVTHQERTQAALGAALMEKEMLIREVDHRVKNSLQLVSSLLALQSAETGNPEVRETLRDATARITAVGRVHDLLYRAGATSHLDFAQYLLELSGDIVRWMSADAMPSLPVVDADRVTVPTEIAVPLALIASELLTNCLKYAYPRRPLGWIGITLRQGTEEVRLSVEDRGVGLPAGFDPAASSGFGMKMILAVAAQLGGRFEADGLAPGSRFTVHVPHAATGHGTTRP